MSPRASRCAGRTFGIRREGNAKTQAVKTNDETSIPNPLSRGTGSSNPFPSSKESANFRSLSGGRIGVRTTWRSCPATSSFARGRLVAGMFHGCPDFEILGGLVIILRQQSERHFQIVLPRQVGQLPEMVCSVATVGNVDHPRETARPVNRSHSDRRLETQGDVDGWRAAAWVSGRGPQTPRH